MASTYRRSTDTYRIADMTVIRIDESGETFDLNAEGEACRDIDEVHAFVRTLCEQGAFSWYVREALLATGEGSEPEVDLEAFRAESAGAGDTAAVATIDRALEGDDEAASEVLGWRLDALAALDREELEATWA